MTTTFSFQPCGDSCVYRLFYRISSIISLIKRNAWAYLVSGWRLWECVEDWGWSDRTAAAAWADASPAGPPTLCWTARNTHTHTHNKMLVSWSLMFERRRTSVSDVEYICWENQWVGAIWSIRLWWSRPAAQELVCFHVSVYKWPSITHVKSSLLMLTACCLTRCVMAVAWLEVAAFLGQTSDCCAFHMGVFSSERRAHVW